MIESVCEPETGSAAQQAEARAGRRKSCRPRKQLRFAQDGK
jgi:hypothetical protein